MWPEDALHYFDLMDLRASGGTELHIPHCVTTEDLHFWLRQAAKPLRGKARHTYTLTAPCIYFDHSSVASSRAFVLRVDFHFVVSHRALSGTIPWTLSPSQVNTDNPHGYGHLM